MYVYMYIDATACLWVYFVNEALLGKDYIGLGCFPPKIDSHKDWTLLDAVEEEGQTALQFQDL